MNIETHEKNTILLNMETCIYKRQILLFKISGIFLMSIFKIMPLKPITQQQA